MFSSSDKILSSACMFICFFSPPSLVCLCAYGQCKLLSGTCTVHYTIKQVLVGDFVVSFMFSLILWKLLLSTQYCSTFWLYVGFFVTMWLKNWTVLNKCNFYFYSVFFFLVHGIALCMSRCSHIMHNGKNKYNCWMVLACGVQKVTVAVFDLQTFVFWLLLLPPPPPPPHPCPTATYPTPW